MTCERPVFHARSAKRFTHAVRRCRGFAVAGDTVHALADGLLDLQLAFLSDFITFCSVVVEHVTDGKKLFSRIICFPD
jgi:hypothetical protein